MNRAIKILAFWVLATAYTCSATNDWVVLPNGIGPIKVGMKLSNLKTDLHLSYSIDFAQDSDQKTCFYANLRDEPGISLMILNGRVARIDIDNKDTKTAEGIRNGDPEADALRVYGKRMKVTPHAYTAPEGHYLTVSTTDGRYGIRFETDEGKIVRYYAGRSEAIRYIEGCE